MTAKHNTAAPTLRDKMLALLQDVNRDIAEREELVELIAIALLTRKNLFILGDPGQAKSYAVNAFRSRITGAKQFERLLSKQSDEEQLFGRIDLSSLIPGAVPQSVLDGDAAYQTLLADIQKAKDAISADITNADSFYNGDNATAAAQRYKRMLAALHRNEPTVQTTGKIPEADIVFLDEIFKCNDGVLNALLTALNERKYTNEGHTYPIPAISFFAASNEIPNFSDPQERILSALYDRLELKVVTENIAERKNRLQVLKHKQAGSSGAITTTITLEDLTAMQAEVAAIPVGEAINELADDILCELRKGGLPVSDRKFLNFYPIVQAKAWLCGHGAVETSDLLALKNYLWQQPNNLSTVESTLERMCINPLQDKVNDIRAAAKEIQEELEAATSAGADSKKAFRKFRSEMLRIHGIYKELAPKAQSDTEQALVNALIYDLERASRTIHEKYGYTYATLEELASLQ